MAFLPFALIVFILLALTIAAWTFLAAADLSRDQAGTAGLAPRSGVPALPGRRAPGEP